MHFKIDKNNKITHFHIERWDREAIDSDKVIDEIESYQGKTVEEFILFSLKNRLFLKTKTLFSMQEDGPTTDYWVNALIYGDESQKKIDGYVLNMKSSGVLVECAKFYLNMTDPEDESKKIITSVFSERKLSILFKENNLPERKIMMELSADEANKISLEFNIARNSINYFDVIIDEDNEDYKNINLKVSSESVSFVAIKNNGSLEVFNNEKELKVLEENISNYIQIQACDPKDEGQVTQIKDTFERINKIKLNKLDNKETVNIPDSTNTDKKMQKEKEAKIIKWKEVLHLVMRFVRKNYKIILIIFAIIISFYWWEFRPSQIKSECAEWALKKAITLGSNGKYEEDAYRDYYSRCLHENGM